MIANVYEAYKGLVDKYADKLEVVRECVENFDDTRATALAIQLENISQELQLSALRVEAGRGINEVADISSIKTMQANIYDVATVVRLAA